MMTPLPALFASAMNVWKPGFMGFARREEQERGFKTTAAAGFTAVELRAGSGRWDPLGRPEGLSGSYGSIAGFRRTLGDWGIARVSSYFWDPTQMSFEDLHFGLDPLNDEQRSRLVSSAEHIAACLQELGGDCLVVRPVGPAGRTGPFGEEQCRKIGRVWQEVAEATARFGVRVALHVDALSSLRTRSSFETVLSELDPAVGGFAFDTAELAIQGHDVPALAGVLASRIIHLHLKQALAVDERNEYARPNAERALFQAGGERRVPRWFAELGHPQGLIDIEGVFAMLCRSGYRGSMVAECDGGPGPAATGVLLNAWYVRHRLLPLVQSV